MAIKKYTFNGRSGVWRTIGGRRVFIADGDDLKTAMKKSGKFNTGDRREVQEVKADERVKKLGKKNEELYRKNGGFADTGDAKRNKEVEKAHKEWLGNAKEANDLKLTYNYGGYDNPKEADKTYDLVGQHINKEQQLGSISNEAKSILMNKYNMSEAEADKQIGIMEDTKARWEEDNLKRMRYDVRNNAYIHDDGYVEDVPKSLKQLQHERRKEQSKIDRNEFANNLERTEIQNRIDEYDKAILEAVKKNQSAGEQHRQLIQELGVKTFADEIKEKPMGRDEYERNMSKMANRDDYSTSYQDYLNAINDGEDVNYLNGEIRKIGKRNWTDAYQEFVKVSEDYPKVSAVQVASSVSQIYEKHKGDPIYEEAFRRFMDGEDTPRAKQTASIRQRYSGTIDYLRNNTDMSEAEIIDLLRKRGKK